MERIMDFDQAVATHTAWKRRLRHSLAKHDGSLRPAEIGVDHRCVLGQWIYGEGAKHFSLPEFTKLKYEHARFHLVAAELVKRANSGELIEPEIAPCSSSEFSTASSAIVIAIMALKKRLSS
jgi:methyl-accepting chemotaxis protein